MKSIPILILSIIGCVACGSSETEDDEAQEDAVAQAVRIPPKSKDPQKWARCISGTREPLRVCWCKGNIIDCR